MTRAIRSPFTLVALSCLGFHPAQAQTLAAPPERVEIIGITPVPGTGVPRDQIPANVQTADDGVLRRRQSLNLPDFMGGQLPSVNVNEQQGNPHQMDVNYRGFSASPLLGTPQGLSVFQDGVRVNEPFGDVVNWDLIPRVALASISLLPGSNPLFGLNTLGGALVLQTRTGLSHPGTEVELQGGSFGRRSLELSHGRGLGAGGHLFLAASSFDEDGWREASPSRVRQLFAKVGHKQAGGAWDLSLTHGDTALIGNGLLPESMLAHSRAQIYTRPDATHNRMTLLTLGASLRPNAQLEISGTAYLRRTRAATLNGDLNDDYDPPAVAATGVENRTRSGQRGAGLALQATLTRNGHRFTLGASHDRARSDFEQTEAEGMLDASRAVVDAEEAEVDAKMGLDTELDGNGRYRRFNPALGVTWQVGPTFTAYGGISQGNRAPSPIELGCSDPENACVLPNALQADPPLKQVVSQTVEAGLRGKWGESLRWNASVYRSVNRDDLLFISNGRAAGYFTNFGRTLRQGLELGASQRGERLDWTVSYSVLRAVFDGSACLVAESNSSAETSAACTGDGEIEVRPGHHLPGLPQHSLKLAVDLKAGAHWQVGAQLSAFSGQYARGNENNAHEPDGGEFGGAGRIGGYALLHLTTSWQLAPGWELFGKLSNVFDRRYASAARLGENAFGPTGVLRAPGDWRNEQFVGPGAPRAFWLGLRWTLDGP
jgi:iron complex outermembrane receptor protein